MKRILFLSALLISAGCATPLRQIPPAGLPAQVLVPAIRVGDDWVYAARDGYTGLPKGPVTYHVAAIQKGAVTVDVTRSDNRSIELYTRDWNWLEKPMTNLQDFRYDPPYAALPFPLEAGKTWRAYVQATDPVTGKANRVRIDGEVLGWERVKVPAGEFDALKVRRLVYAGNFDYFRMEDNIVEFDWYAPQLGQIVKSESSSQYIDTSRFCRFACHVIRKDWNVMELVSYRRGAGASGS